MWSVLKQHINDKSIGIQFLFVCYDRNAGTGMNKREVGLNTSLLEVCFEQEVF